MEVEWGHISGSWLQQSVTSSVRDYMYLQSVPWAMPWSSRCVDIVTAPENIDVILLFYRCIYKKCEVLKSFAHDHLQLTAGCCRCQN